RGTPAVAAGDRSLATRTRVWRAGHAEVREIVVPVLRRATPKSSPESEASEVFGLAADPPARVTRDELVGWVRVAVSTAGIERSIANEARLGFVVLAVAIALALAAASILVRVVVQPVREASDLARGIAAR